MSRFCAKCWPRDGYVLRVGALRVEEGSSGWVPAYPSWWLGAAAYLRCRSVRGPRKLEASRLVPEEVRCEHR